MGVLNVLVGRSVFMSVCVASDRRSYRKQLQNNCGCMSSEGGAWAWKTNNMSPYRRMERAFQQSWDLTWENCVCPPSLPRAPLQLPLDNWTAGAQIHCDRSGRGGGSHFGAGIVMLMEPCVGDIHCIHVHYTAHMRISCDELLLDSVQQ